MGKKGKKMQAGKPKKLTPKGIGKRLDALVKKLEEELKDADLFAPLPPTEDCAICLVPFSRVRSETWHYTCCGNEICLACYKENKVSINKQNEKNTGKKVALTCPFCRKPAPTSDEQLARIQARCLQNDPTAFQQMGKRYREGKYGTPKDDLKSLDYYIRAVELGSPEACTRIGKGYREGNAVHVAVDKEKTALFNRVGALRGDIVSRHNIGCSEYDDLGNYDIAIRHWKIAAEAGFQKSLNALRDIYNSNGKFFGKEFITKEYLVSAYRACHEAQMEVKTEEREKYRDEE